MAKPGTATKQAKRAQAMDWPGLQALWEEIASNKVSDWHAGKALEYLVIRGFEIASLRVEYPYTVPSAGKLIEQIDGLVYLDNIPFLIECKDKDRVDIEAIAKLHNQLLRRPPATMGCLFSSGTFTAPALLLAGYMVPYRILLWTKSDIERAIENKDFLGVLRQKYEHLCMYGLIDDSPDYQTWEVRDD